MSGGPGRKDSYYEQFKVKPKYYVVSKIEYCRSCSGTARLHSIWLTEAEARKAVDKLNKEFISGYAEYEEINYLA